MPSLNIFANFFIDTPERLQRMKDSYRSFCGARIEKWVVNIRGSRAEEAAAFLQDEIGDRLKLYRLNSPEGWFHDTRKMLDDLDGDFVLFWLEDHLYINEPERINHIVGEMHERDLEYLLYTFWHHGFLRERYRGTDMKKGRFLDYFLHDEKANHAIQGSRHSMYILSAAAIFNNALFKKIILADDPKPRRWPKETPFDFEKAPQDTHWLPIRVGVTTEELFASIDDDHDVLNYSLQSRGLYPVREERITYTNHGRLNWEKFVPVPNYLKGLLKDLRLFLKKPKGLRQAWKVVNDPKGPLGCYGWLESMEKRASIDGRGNSLPWISYPAIEFLQKRVPQSAVVYEYGCGYGTRWWAQRCAEVRACEHEKSWFDEITKHLPDNASVRFFELQKDGDYCRSVLGHERKFDIIVVNGRDRINCVKQSVKCLSDRGVLLLDNSDRAHYSPAILFLQDLGFRRLDFWGPGPGIDYLTCTSVFYQDGNCLGI